MMQVVGEQPQYDGGDLRLEHENSTCDLEGEASSLLVM